MPEITVTENRYFVLRENNIWFPGEGFDIRPVPVIPAPQRLPKQKLRLRVFPLDGRHDLMGDGGIPGLHFFWMRLSLFRHGLLPLRGFRASSRFLPTLPRPAVSVK